MKFLYFFSVISCSAGEGGSEKSLAASSREGNRGRSSPHADSGRGSGLGVSVPGCGSPGTAPKGASLGSVPASAPLPQPGTSCWQSPEPRRAAGGKLKTPRDWERALPYLPAGQEVLVNVLAFSFRALDRYRASGGEGTRGSGSSLEHSSALHGRARLLEGPGAAGLGQNLVGKGGGDGTMPLLQLGSPEH